MNDTPNWQLVAAQLRKPEGEMGLEVGRRMNDSNRLQNEEAMHVLAIGQKPASLVEIGPGNGGFVAEWLERWHQLQYVGIDFSQTMVEEATRLNHEMVRQGRAHFLLGDAASLPLDAEVADYILTANTLYFWPDPAAVLTEFHRILKPGGRAVIAARSAETMALLPFTSYGFRPYDQAQLEALLQASPFPQTHIHTFFEPMRTSASGHTTPSESFIALLIK